MAAFEPVPAASLLTIGELRDERFDVVHLHEPLAPGPTLTALVLHDGPIVGTFHRAGESGWVRNLRPLARWASASLTIRAAVSVEARDTALRAMPGEYELVWNGIDLAHFQSAEPWPADGPAIMFIGRHEPRKGLAVLIEAMGSLGPDVRLWVASKGPETERLMAQTAGDRRIEWLGIISEAEKIARIRAARVLCAPSLHGESFGVILLEGMAAGVPVVASDLVGYRNVARPDVDALLTPPGDAAALAKALEAALAGGPGIEAMVRTASARAATFSLDSLATRYVELYEKAMARAGRY
jgi:phosphatidylinositol alpha-mannosyltransferase